MKTSRREFIRNSGSAVLGAGVMGMLGPQMAFGDGSAETAGKPTLICIYLRGGADPLGTIVPYHDPLYYQVRPTIAIPPQDTDGEPGVLKLNKLFGLNPAMKPLMPYFEQGMVAPIVNVGSHHPTRSHFDAQDFMEYGAPGIRSITEGWLNRYLTATRTSGDSELRALALQALLPRSVRGDYPVLAVPDGDSGRAMDAFEALYACKEDAAMNRAMTQKEREMAGAKGGGSKSALEVRHSITNSGKATIRTLRRLQAILAQSGSGGRNYPRTAFAQKLANIATVIKANAGLEIAALDYRGWDHHARQGGVEGRMSVMLGDVSAGLAAFMGDIGTHLNKTLVLVMSEFGRTVRENGNNGSDHGHGGFMLALGGMIKTKKIYGKWVGLEKGNLWKGRDMPVHTDFRLVFAEVLQRLFKFDALGKDFFPEYKPQSRPLNFLKQI